MSRRPGKEPLRIAVMCGGCDGGLVPVEGCTCGSPGYPDPHERYCGYEPCPSGCWWRLHPGAPGAPADTVVRLWIEAESRISLKRFAGGFPVGEWTDGKICQASPGGRRKIFGNVRCWGRLRYYRGLWSAGTEGHCRVWAYRTPLGALRGARELHGSRLWEDFVSYMEMRSPWLRGLLQGLLSMAVLLVAAIVMAVGAMFAAGHP